MDEQGSNLPEERAVTLFREGYNCAQSVLFAWSGSYGLVPDTALRLACGFGAGIARNGDICGAVTGGIMVLGLAFGRGRADDRSATERTYAATRQLIARFTRMHGTHVCRLLLNGCDLESESGRQCFKEQQLLEKTCAPCVVDVVTILRQLVVSPSD